MYIATRRVRLEAREVGFLVYYKNSNQSCTFYSFLQTGLIFAILKISEIYAVQTNLDLRKILGVTKIFLK